MPMSTHATVQQAWLSHAKRARDRRLGRDEATERRLVAVIARLAIAFAISDWSNRITILVSPPCVEPRLRSKLLPRVFGHRSSNSDSWRPSEGIHHLVPGRHGGRTARHPTIHRQSSPEM